MIKYSSEKIKRIAAKLSPEALVSYRDNLLTARMLKESEILALKTELAIIESVIAEQPDTGRRRD